MTQTSETSETVTAEEKKVVIEEIAAPVELDYTAEQLIELAKRSDVGLIPSALFSPADYIAISPSYEGVQLVRFRTSTAKYNDLVTADVRQKHIINYMLSSSIVPSEELITAIYEIDSNPPYDLAAFKTYTNKVVDLVRHVFSLFKPSEDPDLHEFQQKVYDIYSAYELEVLVGYTILPSTTAIDRPNLRVVPLNASNNATAAFNKINEEITDTEFDNKEVLKLWNRYLEIRRLKKDAERMQLVALQEIASMKRIEQQHIEQLNDNRARMYHKEKLAEIVVENAKNMQIYLANNSFAASGVHDGDFWGITGWNVVELQNYLGYPVYGKSNSRYQILTKYRLLPPVVVMVKDILTTKGLRQRWSIAVLEEYKQYFKLVSYDGRVGFNKSIPHQSAGNVVGVGYNAGKITIKSYGINSCVEPQTEIMRDLYNVSQNHCVTDYKFLNMFRTLPQYANARDGYGSSALALLPISQKYVDIIRSSAGQDIHHDFINDQDRIKDSFELICEADSIATKTAKEFISKFAISDYNKGIVIPKEI